MENEEQKTALAPLSELTAVEAFTGDALDSILRRIEDEVSGFIPDLTTATGRKAIASMAHKVSKSKVVIEDLGKGLVSEWKDKAKKVDASRRQSREFLDNLRDKVRKPLTDWEAEKEAEEQAELRRIADEAAAEKAKIEADRAVAQKEEDEKREAAQKILDDREAAIAKREEEARQKAERIQGEADRKEEVARLRQEAEELALARAEEQVQKAQEDAARRVAEEKIKAENAERARVEAEARAKIEQEQAVQKAKDDAVAEARRKESERLEAELAKKRADEARQADEDHRRNINRAALSGVMDCGVDEATAKKVITAISKGIIQNVTINY